MAGKWAKKEAETKETNESDKSASGLKSLPQLMEQEGAWTKRAVHLLEMYDALKTQIGDKGDEKKGEDGRGLLGRLREIEDELRLIQMEHDLAGLRHNNLVFRCVVREGRETLDKKELRIALAERGVDLGVINEAFEVATKKGDGYWVKEFRVLE